MLDIQPGDVLWCDEMEAYMLVRSVTPNLTVHGTYLTDCPDWPQGVAGRPACWGVSYRGLRKVHAIHVGDLVVVEALCGE